MFYQLCRMTNGFDAPFEVNAVVKGLIRLHAVMLSFCSFPFNYSMPMSRKNGKELYMTEIPLIRAGLCLPCDEFL